MGPFSRKKKDKVTTPATATATALAAPVQPWDASRFRVQLKMAKSRIEIQRSKKENEIEAQRRKIAEHLHNKKEPLARILGDRVLRERTSLIAYDILETCVEVLISSNNNLISNNDLSNAPGDLQESICSIVYATPRVNVPELLNVVDMLKFHYGSHVIEPIAKMEGSFINRVNEILVVQLAGNPTDGYLILQELEQIAKENGIMWSPPPEETDLNNFHAYSRNFNFGSDGNDPYDGDASNGGSYVPSNIPGAPPPFDIPGQTATAPPPDTPQFPTHGPNTQQAPDSGTPNDYDALQARFNDILGGNK